MKYASSARCSGLPQSHTIIAPENQRLGLLFMERLNIRLRTGLMVVRLSVGRDVPKFTSRPSLALKAGSTIQFNFLWIETNQWKGRLYFVRVTSTAV